MPNSPADLADALCGQLPWIKGASWQGLSGGRSNVAWRVMSRDQHHDIVVKSYRASNGNPVFPNDAEAEARALFALGGTGLAPEFLFATQIGGEHVLAYNHVAGTTWTSGARQIGELLKTLHGLPPDPELRPLAGGSESIRAQVAQLRLTSGDLEAPDAPSVPPAPRAALLHGDPVAGNLVVTKNGPVLIDWQCPAIGDPCEDISHFLSPAMQLVYRGAPLERDEVDAFWDGYADDVIHARYRQLAPWFHWRMIAYCRFRVRDAHPEYGPAEVLERHALQESLRR